MSEKRPANGEKRPTNSELRLNRLEEEDSEREHEPGILEIFDDQKPEPDEDASLPFDEEASPRHDPPE